MEKKYAKAYTEVLEILKHIPEDEYERIPKTEIQFYENNCDKTYKFIYDESLNVKDQSISKEANAVIVEKKEKTVNNTYLMQKEKNKIITRIKKIERDITELENKVAELNEELLKEEVYTNYEKLTEVQNKIQNLNEKIENDMNEWEELASKLEE